MKDIFIRGGPVMWPLLICSVISLMVIVERILFLWKEKKKSRKSAAEKICQQTESGETQQKLSPGETASYPPVELDSRARILMSGLQHRDEGLRESMEMAAMDEIDNLKRGLDVLDTIITMAPLLGILGTVLGIIDSFHLLGQSGIETPRAVTGGIAQALITTATGLTIALMTLVPFNYLVGNIRTTTNEFNKLITRFELIYQRGLKKGNS